MDVLANNPLREETDAIIMAKSPFGPSTDTLNDSFALVPFEYFNPPSLESFMIVCFIIIIIQVVQNNMLGLENKMLKAELAKKKEMDVEGDPSVNTNNSIVCGGGWKGILVKVISGPHVNATFCLFPKGTEASLVGRSSGITKGVSLPQDKEISTDHGKFTIVNGTPYFTDNRSTNGTFFKRKIDADEPLQLSQGMVLSLGTSELEIELLDQDAPMEEGTGEEEPGEDEKEPGEDVLPEKRTRTRPDRLGFPESHY